MRFEFAAASRILFGEGVLAELGGIARSLGVPALLVTGATPARAAPVWELLVQAGVPVTTCAVAREPDVVTVLACVNQQACHRRHAGSWLWRWQRARCGQGHRRAGDQSRRHLRLSGGDRARTGCWPTHAADHCASHYRRHGE